MKTVLDYIKVLEDAVPTNVVSSGAIATVTKPIGKVKKREEPATVESVGSDPLATVYAPEHPENVTVDGSDEAKKRMFHLRQQSQSDQVMSYD